MKVYVFRHALADFSKHSSDPENPPLTKEGRDQVKSVTSAAKDFGFAPNLIVASPLVRAQETAELTRENLGVKSQIVVEECLLGSKRPEQVYEFLGKRKKSEQIVLVSHQPLIDRLTFSLLGGKSNFHFINGAIACIDVESRPAKGKGTLSWFIPPPS